MPTSTATMATKSIRREISAKTKVEAEAKVVAEAVEEAIVESEAKVVAEAVEEAIAEAEAEEKAESEEKAEAKAGAPPARVRRRGATSTWTIPRIGACAYDGRCGRWFASPSSFFSSSSSIPS